MESVVPEPYMLPRDISESQRLDAQHDYFRQLSYGHLVHPSIPADELRTVADIATGTGIWLRQLAEESSASSLVETQRPEFVGFDISQQQFPPQGSLPARVTLVVHDMVQPFPAQYHGHFDLVNVRLVSYAVKEMDLDKIVRNVIQLLRPGGYLQWQETDASESWTHPEVSMATSCINYVIAEKIDRGLHPGIAAPLVKAIVSSSAPLADGQHNTITWSPSLMRLTHLETISTLGHPSPAVQAAKDAVVMSAAKALLQARMTRKSSVLESLTEQSPEAELLSGEIKSINNILKAIEHARKAIAQPTARGWVDTKSASTPPY
ncbi:MAG: hypothetical protein Q9219_004436 [cf. Caloplaca sp. 3 TL-2023]